MIVHPTAATRSMPGQIDGARRRPIGIVDQTMRDAPQSLWATRMTTASMLPVAERMDRIGFDGIDIMAQVQIDVCIRFLKENPWERLRLMRERITRTPLRAFMRAKGFNFNDILAQDLIDLWIERLVANGIHTITAFDGLNDINNLLPIVNQTKKVGARANACITYSVSPVHTTELYVSTARELVKAGVDIVMLKDSGGLLTVDAIRVLVPALKAVLGRVPLEVHSHCTTGLGPLVYLEAAGLGADVLHTSIAPLANGTANPSIQSTASNLRALGQAVHVDDNLIGQVSEHFAKVARREGKPLGTIQEYDVTHYHHQLPGGMVSNFKASLEQAGMADRYPAVLEECVRVRKELGWPMGITPFSQIIGTQALINIVRGERYRNVPDVVKKYALGYFGRPLAPVEPDVLDKIVENGSKDIPLKPVPPEPMVPALRKQFPNMSDDERLLRSMYAGPEIVDSMLAAPPIATDSGHAMPLLKLVKELAARSEPGRRVVRGKNLEIEVETRR